MQIKGVSVSVPMARPSGGAGTGKRARIEKQIKELEERKRKLMKRLAGLAGGGDSKPSVKPSSVAPSGPAGADFPPAAPAAGATETTAAVQTSPPGGTGGPAAPAPALRIAPPLSPAPPAKLAFRAPLPAKGDPPPSADDMLPDDPKLLLRMILSIDLLIMALRQQLADEELLDGLDLTLPEPGASDALPPAAAKEGGQAYRNRYGDTVALSAEALRQS